MPESTPLNVNVLKLITRKLDKSTNILIRASFFIIFVSDGKLDNSMDVRKRAD